MDAVDEQQRAGGVDQVGQGGTSGRVPSTLDAAVTATSRVRVAQHRREVVGPQLAGLEVEVDPAHRRTGPLGRLHPGPDVGVVVEPRHDHLVAGPPSLREGARQVVRQRGHAAAEDDAAPGRPPSRSASAPPALLDGRRRRRAAGASGGCGWTAGPPACGSPRRRPAAAPGSRRDRRRTPRPTPGRGSGTGPPRRRRPCPVPSRRSSGDPVSRTGQGDVMTTAGRAREPEPPLVPTPCLAPGDVDDRRPPRCGPPAVTSQRQLFCSSAWPVRTPLQRAAPGKWNAPISDIMSTRVDGQCGAPVRRPCSARRRRCSRGCAGSRILALQLGVMPRPGAHLVSRYQQNVKVGEIHRPPIIRSLATSATVTYADQVGPARGRAAADRPRRTLRAVPRVRFADGSLFAVALQERLLQRRVVPGTAARPAATGR